MKRSVLFVVAALASGCASGGGGSAASTPAPAATSSAATSSPATAPTTRRGNAELITQDEISAAGVRNALEVIQRVRPSMLRPRGSSTNQSASPEYSQATTISVVVYMDDIRLGEPSQLSSLSVDNIREIRFINARDATTRWGTGHTAGVIQVVSKAGSK
jgi:hypothetical protein